MQHTDPETIPLFKPEPELQRLLEARHHDPFTLLGLHRQADREMVRTHLPGAAWVRIAETGYSLERIGNTDLFEWHGQAGSLPDRYRLIWRDCYGAEHVAYDPYCFPEQLSEYDLHLFSERNHWHIYRVLGAHRKKVDGINGVLFAVWAPSADRVSVVGDFNGWDGRMHPMRVRGGSGVWELFIPGLGCDQHYKFEIRTRNNGNIIVKSDPYGQQFELRPATASLVCKESGFRWQDDDWIEHRRNSDWQHGACSVYEVHLGSWRRDNNGHFLNYRDLARGLVDYVSQTGFTHIELLPVTEHPLDASWG